MWFLDESEKSPAIGRITPSGAIVEFRTGLPHGVVANSLTVGPGGNLWFTEVKYGASQSAYVPTVGRIAPTGAITEFFAGKNRYHDPLVQSTSDIVTGPEGDLWFAAHVEGLEVVGHEGFGQWPFGYWDQGALGRLTPSGQFTFVAQGLPTYSMLSDLQVGPDDRLWFADCDCEGFASPKTTYIGWLSLRQPVPSATKRASNGHKHRSKTRRRAHVKKHSA